MNFTTTATCDFAVKFAALDCYPFRYVLLTYDDAHG